MEGVADVLVSSLEEERQVVFGFLFTFFDETLTLLQECSCDVELFPWGPGDSCLITKFKDSHTPEVQLPSSQGNVP